MVKYHGVFKQVLYTLYPVIPCNTMVYHGISWYIMVYHGVPYSSMVYVHKDTTASNSSD